MISADMMTGFCGVFCGDFCADILWLAALFGDIDVGVFGIFDGVPPATDPPPVAAAAPAAAANGAIWFGVPNDFRASKLFFLWSFLSFMVFW